MGCVHSIMARRSNAYRVNESSTLLEEDDALESKRAKTPDSKAAGKKEQETKAAEVKAKDSKKEENTKKPEAQPEAKSKAPESKPQAAAKAKLDPKDFMFCGLKNETKVKEPGCAITPHHGVLLPLSSCNILATAQPRPHSASATAQLSEPAGIP